MSAKTLADQSTTRTAATPELLMQLRRPAEAVVSADGRRVAFTVVNSFAERGARAESAIWTATREGVAEQLTGTPGAVDAVPRWSPDGRTLAFTSDRDHPGRMALYLVTDGEEPRRLADITGSVEDLCWSPDATELLVLAADLGADRAGVQLATKISESGAEEDPKVYRPAEAWRRLYRVDAAGGQATVVSPEGTNIWEFDWRGGPHAAVVASDDPSESGWYDAHIALLEIDEQTTQTLYQPDWQLAYPRLSPDGAKVCFVEGFCSDRGLLAGTVTAFLIGGGEPRELAPELDISWLEWRDESRLWYAGWRGLGAICGSLGLDGTVEEVWSGDASLGYRYQPRISASSDGRVLASVIEDGEHAPEAAVLDPASERPSWQRISQLNVEVAASIEPPRWERLVWRGRDGLELEGLLARPRERAGQLPLVTFVHGGPTASWTYQYLPPTGLALLLVGAGYGVFMPNPRGSSGRGQDFARANMGDMGGEDLQDILAGVDACIEAGIADEQRLAITGGSYGGFMTAWAITQTDRFAAAVAIACVSDWLSFHLTTNIGRFDELFLDADPYDETATYASRSPILHARDCSTPTLVIHGEADLCTPVGQAKELYQALVEAGVETELVVYPREGHGWLERDHQIDAWARVHAWLERHLNGK